MKPLESDLMQMQHCSFAQNISDTRYQDTVGPYKDYMWIMNDCKDGYKKQLALNDDQYNNMNFRDSYHWGDVIFA